eukprot:3041871-Rhodomonas_salina.1
MKNPILVQTALRKWSFVCGIGAIRRDLAHLELVDRLLVAREEATPAVGGAREAKWRNLYQTAPIQSQIVLNCANSVPGCSVTLRQFCTSPH